MPTRYSRCSHPGELGETYMSSLISILALLRENMTSSTKPEAHNVSHCRHRQTEPRHMYVTCAESPVKFGCVIYEICEWADRQTNRQTYRYATDRWRNKNSTERCRCQLFATSRRQLFRFYLRRRQVTISKSYFLHSFVFIYHHLIIFIIRSRQSKK